MIVQIVVAALLSLAVAPVVRAQTEAERAAERRAESEAGVSFQLRVIREESRLKLIGSSMCESYRVRAKSIERVEKEFPSARDMIDLEEFPFMAVSWQKEAEAMCRENVQRRVDSIDSGLERIEDYRSGESDRCCGLTDSEYFRARRVSLLYMEASALCLRGRRQLHVKGGVDRMLKNPRLAGIGLLDQKAGSLAQTVADAACPLMDKYESWLRDESPDYAASIFDN